MTIAPGAAFGSRAIASIDASGKRATCVCVCGVTCVISVQALESGSAASSCGCAVPTREHIKAIREEATQRRRQRDHDWRPGERP
jgi:hypothetical protein